MTQLRQHTLNYDDLERTYQLYTPSPPAGDLVLVLHGGGGNARNIIRLVGAGFNALADQHHFLIAYPDGVRRQWNDGRRFRRQSPADDVGFIRALIDRIAADQPVNRVFVTGISNGGFMSGRLACELSDRITAIAPVAATLPAWLMRISPPARPVAVQIIMGTADPLVPYNGGLVRISLIRRGAVLSAEAAAQYWADVNHCDPNPHAVLLPPRHTGDPTRIQRITYSGGAAPVILYRIEGGGHTWPNAAQYLPVRIVGRVSRQIDACSVIWDFFAQQRA